MLRIFDSFLFKLILTVIISVFIGTQLAKIELKEYSHSFRKVLGVNEVKGDTELEDKIKELLQEEKGDYAVYVKDLMPEGKRNVYIRSDEVFESASLYKLFLMGAVFEKINSGEIGLDTEISAKISHLDAVLGGREYGYEDYSPSDSIGHTVKECLDRIAMFSDNYCAVILAEKISWDNVQAFADEIGTVNTTIKSPISTTAEDVGLVLEKLYHGEVVSFESSEQIINMLAKAQNNDRIPAKLPEGVKVAHKTGELSGVRNDAGIVFLEGNPYLIVLMTKNIGNIDDAVANEAEISKIVYDYYSSNSDQ